MDISFQSSMLMMLSSLKNNNSNNILSTLIIMLLPYFVRIIPFDEISNVLLEYWKKFRTNKVEDSFLVFSTHEKSVLKSFTNGNLVKLEYSEDFFAIVYFLTNNKNINITSLTEIMTDNTFSGYDYDEDKKEKNNKYMLIPINNTNILVDNNNQIYCDFTIDNIKDDDNNNNNNNNNKNKNNNNKEVANSTRKLFKIKLYIKNSKNLKTDERQIDILQNFVKNCINEYLKSQIIKNEEENIPTYYDYIGCEKSDCNKIELMFDESPLDHNKDLYENVFVEELDKIINLVKPFIYNPIETSNETEKLYKKCGKAFKLGMCFYGKTGTGKTTLGKAIQKITDRNIVHVNLDNLRTKREAKKLFSGNLTINKRKLKSNQIIYLLEDCDAVNNDFIKSRKREDNNNDNDKINLIDKNENFYLNKLNELTTTTVKMLHEDEDKMNLSYLLNLLDGVVELHGVIIIMTTNHIEKIDEALIRPGRFDFVCELKHASKKIIKQMLQFIFELIDSELESYSKEIEDIVDEALSPADIQNIFFNNLQLEYISKDEKIRRSINEMIIKSNKK
jgi:ATP-dependent 26S proteasome regulatory subunit